MIKMIRNSKGMSLISVLIGAAVMGILVSVFCDDDDCSG